MSNINLLPWRESVRAAQKKQFMVILSVASLITVSVMLVANMWINQQTARQQQRNQFLQSETAKLDLILGEMSNIREQRLKLLERMNLIDSFQQRRNLSVRLFNQLPELVPPGVYLSSLNVVNNQIDIVGKTEAYPRVANMIREVERRDWLYDPRLSSIFASDVQPIALSQFSMQLKVREHTPGVIQ
ncbi:PilN domain-containing protein [Oceanisphaera arctica]|uniref:Fimbrial assembly protein n=1 Tax=Oceanisphaera arctica TaxID=641510 RepID=A0A2P5TMS9_9GAMM|nr:PilN domain-containing protein [Oceanisphaera arctica]PPL16791.1 fimbrial assembly protein [Oceanisphaera arctica]GHA05730.1 fimbrial protein [Oceanisphaera arctica]